MYELNLSNYKFPSLGGLYNTEGSSFHLTEVLYNVSNIYNSISINPFLAFQTQNMLYSRDLNHLKLYCVYGSALFTGIFIVPDDGWYCKLKHVAQYTCHPPGTWNLEVGIVVDPWLPLVLHG